MSNLAELREEYDAACQVFNNIGATNTVGLDADARVKLDIAFRRATDRQQATYIAYHRAIAEAAKE